MKRINEARISALFVVGLAMSLGIVGCGDDSGTATDPIGGDDAGPGSGGGGNSGATAGSGASGTGSSGNGGRSGASGQSGSAGATSEAGAGGATTPAAGRGAAGVAGSEAGRGGAAAGSGGSEAGSGGMDDDAGVDEGEPQAGTGGRGGAGGRGGRGGRGGTGGAGGAGAGGAGGAGGSGGDEGEAGSGGAGDGPRCGTRGGATCDDDEFCNFEPDEDCGGTDRGGVCEERPEACTAIYDPVCGCDNRTYASECQAHGAGVSVKRDELCDRDECTQAGGRVELSDGASTPSCESGEEGWNIESGGDEGAVCCLGDDGEEPTGETCGGIAQLECDGDGEFCNYDVSAGGQGCDGSVADAGGVCEERPTFCTREYRPVCGCDRKSYGNACEAHAMGASILHDGACTESDCEYVDGRVEFGIGPAPMCDPDEVEFTYIVDDSGAIPIEGAICCVEE